MEKIEITLYQFSELSEESKQNALSTYEFDMEYIWGYEALDSIKAFFREIGVTLTNYSIDWLSPSQSYVKYQGTPHTQFIKHDLTGFCFDYSLTTKWNKTRDIEDSVHALLVECMHDYEYLLSEEAYSEHCQANEIYFDQQGNIF